MRILTNISVTNNVTLITLKKVPIDAKLLADIFMSLSEKEINIDMISQAPFHKDYMDICFTISDKDLTKALECLGIFQKSVTQMTVEVSSSNTKISTYGEAMKHTCGVAAHSFSIIAQNNIEIKLITTSEVDISYLMNDDEAVRFYALLNDAE